MKPADVKAGTYIDFGIENSNKDPKFKVGEYVKISKYKNIFVKGYAPDWYEEAFLIKKVKSTVRWTYVISYLNGEEIAATYYKKKLQKKKKNQKEFRVGKVIKRKRDKLYVK